MRSASRANPMRPSQPMTRRSERRAHAHNPWPTRGGRKRRPPPAGVAKRPGGGGGKEAEARLGSRIAEAEKAIAATRSAAMTNVRAIAGEAAGAIVERLTGVTPASQEITEAVGTALKR